MVAMRLPGVEEPVVSAAPMTPGWRFAAARVPSFGDMAWGKGPTDADALASCLGEAAEMLALLAHPGDEVFCGIDPRGGPDRSFPAAQVVIADPRRDRGAGSEGVAAGRNRSDAVQAAVLERLERAAVARWWAGAVAPVALTPDWMEKQGLAALLAGARAGSSVPRVTRLLLLDGPAPVATVAALSEDPAGGRPVLGYAAALCPVRAAGAALSELFQMEMGVSIALAARDPGVHAAVFARMAAFAGPRSDLLRPRSDCGPDPVAAAPGDLARALDGLGTALWIIDLTRAGTGMPVVRAMAPGLPSLVPLRGSLAPL